MFTLSRSCRSKRNGRQQFPPVDVKTIWSHTERAIYNHRCSDRSSRKSQLVVVTRTREEMKFE